MYSDHIAIGQATVSFLAKDVSTVVAADAADAWDACAAQPLQMNSNLN